MPLYAGTSGFSYPKWRGGFYPADARPDELLGHYASRLTAVELNVTGYRLPSEDQLRRWADATPPDFRFAVRMSRRVTDRGDAGGVGVFCERVRALGSRLGPLLVKLPPERPRDDGFLQLLLGSIDPSLQVALQLDHETWRAPAVGEAIAAGGAVRVGALEGEASFRYVRMREPPYDDEALATLAAEIRPQIDTVAVYCFFKHEDDPRGAIYAERLRKSIADS
jgi:uncharacterized protein YecE (DUF72 family)